MIVVVMMGGLIKVMEIGQYSITKNHIKKIRYHTIKKPMKLWFIMIKMMKLQKKLF